MIEYVVILSAVMTFIIFPLLVVFFRSFVKDICSYQVIRERHVRASYIIYGRILI